MKFKPVLRLIVTGIAIATTFTLTACGGKKTTDTTTSTSTSTSSTTNTSTSSTTDVATTGKYPIYKMLDGQFDESALAKKVLAQVQAMPNLPPSARVYVAQLGSTVVFKGNGNSDTIKMITDLARTVEGTGNVDSYCMNRGVNCKPK